MKNLSSIIRHGKRNDHLSLLKQLHSKCRTDVFSVESVQDFTENIDALKKIKFPRFWTGMVYVLFSNINLERIAEGSYRIFDGSQAEPLEAIWGEEFYGKSPKSFPDFDGTLKAKKALFKYYFNPRVLLVHDVDCGAYDRHLARAINLEKKAQAVELKELQYHQLIIDERT